MEALITELELTALYHALAHLWHQTGGKGQPWGEWQREVLKTVFGEDRADPVPTAHLPGPEQCWRLKAMQEAVNVLEDAVSSRQQSLTLLGTVPLTIILDPEEEAKMRISEAADDLYWTAPLVALLQEQQRGKLFRMLVRRCVDQLSRILVALAELDALEEAS